jgi:hypothetical protein
MGKAQDTNDIGSAAFKTKHHDVSKLIKALHVEVEMFRVLAGDKYLLDKAATLAEVEQYVKAALNALRESDERRAAEQEFGSETGEVSRTVTNT